MNSARYVYAIVRRDAPVPTTISAGPLAELATVPWRQLAAVTRCLSEPSPHLTIDAVLEHELVVEAVREKSPALPVRFGTVFQSAESVASALAERYELLAADLDRLGDKAEMSLTALWAAPPAGCGVWDAGCGKPGADYLRARAAELQHDEALRERARSHARKMSETLGELAIEARVSLAPTPRIAIRASYLIDPARTNAVRAAFEAERRAHVEFRMLLTGPWPPYSFAAPTDTEALATTNRATSLAQFLTDAMQERRCQSAAARR